MGSPAHPDHLEANTQDYFHAISKEASDCVLITSQGHRVEVQSMLLAAASPFLASLLAQAGSSTCISLPSSSSSLLSSLIASLVGGQVFTEEEERLAAVLGIKCQMRRVDTKLKSGGEVMQNFQNKTIEKQKAKPPPVLGGIHEATNKSLEESTKFRGKIGLTIGNSPNQEAKPEVKLEPIGKQESKIFDVKKFVFQSSHNSSQDIKLKQLSIKDDSGIRLKPKSVRTSSTHVGSDLQSNEHDKFGDGKASEAKSALCNVCSEMFTNRNALRVHMRSHAKPEDTICDVCSKSFSNIYTLKTHILTHTQQKVQCEICSESVFSLKGHMKRRHGERKYRKLETCSKCGVEVKLIEKHEKLCNMSEEERFEYRERLKVQCESCPKILANKFKLTRHIRSAHSKEKLLQCNFCDHKDSRKDNLKTHIKNNHSQII